jgi:hypothetical protein
MAMNPDAPINLNHHCLLQITPETTDFELEVMRWFADGHEILWIPIYEATDEPTGIADAKAEMAHYGGQRLIRDVTDFCQLPVGIKGWLFPAHLDDTDVVCTRTTAREVTFGTLTHPVTGQRLTYRFPTEVGLFVP